MNYLISKFPCFVNELNVFLEAGAKYKLEEIENKYYTFFVNHKPIYINFCALPEQDVVKVDYLQNSYYFLFYFDCPQYDFKQIKCKGTNVFLSFNKELVLSLDGEEALRVTNLDFKYSHNKTFGDYVVLFFEGKRRFFVIIKNKEICAYDFYDEINIGEKELYLMAKKFDCLNHGRVYHIENNTYESYLVYLDDFEMKLKSQFCHLVFLDCLLAGNYKYCNSLLTENLKQDEATIKDFFADFDFYYPLDENSAACFKKNALVGIYKFEIENGSISNIVSF